MLWLPLYLGMSLASFAGSHEGDGEKFVANPLVCKKCHQAQYDFWETTKHSSAYLVLYSKNQHFDPSCVGCHTLGFRESGGFQAITRPAMTTAPGNPKKPWVESLMEEVFEGDNHTALDSRKDPARYSKLAKRYHETVNAKLAGGTVSQSFISVQCEHCHGSRVEHIKTRKRGVRFNVNTCRSCHRPPNAPKFDVAKLKSQSCPKMAHD